MKKQGQNKSIGVVGATTIGVGGSADLLIITIFMGLQRGII